MFTRNFLDKPFFSGMNFESYKDDEAEESSGVSCSPAIKKLKTAEGKYDCPNSAVPSATRYLLGPLEKPFFSGLHHKKDGSSRVSTELKLFDETWVALVVDPWKVKKKLTASDVSPNQTRLLVCSGLVKAYILPVIGATEEQIKNGIHVRVWDCDTRTLHYMKFQRWKSKSYVLKGKWKPEFVERRNLKENETIGLYWDVSESRFHFSVLE